MKISRRYGQRRRTGSEATAKASGRLNSRFQTNALIELGREPGLVLIKRVSVYQLNAR